MKTLLSQSICVGETRAVKCEQLFWIQLKASTLFIIFTIHKSHYLILGLWTSSRYSRCNPLIIYFNRTKAFHNNIFILCSNFTSILGGDSLCLWIRVSILNYWLNFGIMLSNQQDGIGKQEKREKKITSLTVATKVDKNIEEDVLISIQ